MAWQKESNFETEDGRKVGEPHPHWRRNLEYFNSLIGLPSIKNKIYDRKNMSHDIFSMVNVVYGGINKDIYGNFEVITYAQVKYKKKIYVVNFHEGHEVFRKKVDWMAQQLREPEKPTSMDQVLKWS